MIRIFSAPGVAASAPSPAPAEGAIDIAHLGRMTFGEKGLEREVLRLFERQAAMLLARMKDAPLPELAAFAHTLTGSARGIGAWQVANAAEAVELAASGGQPDLAAALVKLTAAVNGASAAITELLRASGTPQSRQGK